MCGSVGVGQIRGRHIDHGMDMFGFQGDAKKVELSIEFIVFLSAFGQMSSTPLFGMFLGSKGGGDGGGFGACSCHGTGGSAAVSMVGSAWLRGGGAGSGF